MDKEDLIKKWLNDELTPAEKQTFEQGEDYALYQSIIDNAKQFKASNVSTPESFNEFYKAYQTQAAKTKQLNWFKPFLRIASVLIIAFGVYFTIFNTSTTKFETLVSEQSTIVLPDQSKVRLNADSKIEFKASDWDENRRLQLDGEAYFKVAKGKTFDVVTSQGVVTVVGTEFNVKQRLDFFEVHCFEGVVEVTTEKITKTLLAGDTFRLLNNVFSQDKTTLLVPQWTQHKSSFKAIPLKDVIAEMERQYDIKIIVENVDANRLFTGGFMHNDIENALLSVTQPMGLSYNTNTSNDVVIHGNKK